MESWQLSRRAQFVRLCRAWGSLQSTPRCPCPCSGIHLLLRWWESKSPSSHLCHFWNVFSGAQSFPGFGPNDNLRVGEGGDGWAERRSPLENRCLYCVAETVILVHQIIPFLPAHRKISFSRYGQILVLAEAMNSSLLTYQGRSNERYFLARLKNLLRYILLSVLSHQLAGWISRNQWRIPKS